MNLEFDVSLPQYVSLQLFPLNVPNLFLFSQLSICMIPPPSRQKDVADKPLEVARVLWPDVAYLAPGRDQKVGGLWGEWHTHAHPEEEKFRVSPCLQMSVADSRTMFEFPFNFCDCIGGFL